jgi:arylsulfatase A-like enzyme
MLEEAMNNRRPNLLVIMVDQLRYDALGFSGCPAASTPHLDQLAREGTWFDRAYTSLPSCCPARQSFLTGKRPEQLGAHWNYDITLKVPSITPKDFTWPQALKQQGYHTGYVGKWHVSPQYDPTAFGYDRYIPESSHREYAAAKYPGLRYQEPFLGEDDPLPLADTRTHYLARRASELMEELAAQNGPWHLRFDLSEPHLPCRPARPFAGRVDPASLAPWGSFSEDFTKKPYIQAQQPISWGLDAMTWEDWAPVVARYHETVSQVDDAVGLVLDRLKALGQEDDTLVIFTADHGDMGGSHRMLDKHYVLYEDVVHVPLIVRMPGAAPGQRIDAFTCHTLDLAATLLEWADFPLPEDIQGESLLPLLAGQTLPGRDQVMSSGNGQQFGLYCQRMLRERRYKYIWNLTDVDELYDLEEDPWELDNRINDPALACLLADLRRRLHDELIRAKDPLAGMWTDRQLLEGKKLVRFGEKAR